MAAASIECLNGVPGMCVPGLMAFEIVPQPDGDFTFVSDRAQVVTQFQAAQKYGVTGLLAHNYLAGGRFDRLKIGQEIVVCDRHGARAHYRVAKMDRYRRVQPYNPLSGLVSLADGSRLTCEQAFDRYYTGAHRLTLQTCLSRFGFRSYGLIFITALPTAVI